MSDMFNRCLWKNFGAAIDMLKNAIALCPDALWQQDSRFFFLSYHTTIFLDYYLSVPARDFQPALPYTLTDEKNLPAMAVDDVIPNTHYSRQEMLDYLNTISNKCRTLIINATGTSLNSRWINPEEIGLHGLCPTQVTNYSVLEILFYNLRHLQHHTGQLYLILRTTIDAAPDWISHTDE